jgi:hypothetical protein
MPKDPENLSINIDLLKSQGSSQKLLAKAIKWLLSAGRYLIIFVELVVLIAFLTRFFIDAQIVQTTEEIARRVPFVEGSKPTEVLIKKTQFQLSTIRQLRANSPEFDAIIQSIADQTPGGISLSKIIFESGTDKTGLTIEGEATTNLELSNFVYGLKTNNSFSDVGIINVELDNELLNFTITGNFRPIP